MRGSKTLIVRRRRFLRVLGLGVATASAQRVRSSWPVSLRSVGESAGALRNPESEEYGLLTCANEKLVAAAAKSRAGIFACTINNQTHCADAGLRWGTSTWLNDLYFGLHGGLYVGGTNQHDIFRRELMKIGRHVHIVPGQPPVPYAVSADGLNAHFNLDGMDLDRCAEFVLEVIRVYEITGDRDFFYDLYPKCLEVLKYLKSRDLDGDLLPEGRTEAFTNPPGKGVGGCASVTYIGDTVANTWKDFGAAMFYYDALERLGLLEKCLGENARGEAHRRHAAEVKKAIKRTFWNTNSGGFLAWVEKDGTPHDDWITGNNLHAILLGLSDFEESSRILAKLDSRRHEIECLVPCRVRVGIYQRGLCSNRPDYYWNGGIWPLLSMPDMRARAIMNDLQGCFQVADLLATHPKVTEYGFYEAYDGKTGRPNECRGLLMNNGGFLWGLFAGVFGVEIDGEKLRLRSVVPKQVVPAKMRMHYRGSDIEFVWKAGQMHSASLNGKPINLTDQGYYSLCQSALRGRTNKIEIINADV